MILRRSTHQAMSSGTPGEQKCGSQADKREFNYFTGAFKIHILSSACIPTSKKNERKKKPRGLSPRANYTGRATAACLES
jgi:hypothetical protein